MTIEELYQQRCKDTAYNIYEHMPTLRRYAEQCDTIVELGTDQGYSTTVFLAAKPKELTSISLNFHGELYRVIDCMCAVEWHKKDFIARCGDTLWLYYDIDDTLFPIPEPIDLLFIDTLHTYKQLSQELSLHGEQAKKWIILHDTATYVLRGEDGSEPGPAQALDEFLKKGTFQVKEQFRNNNGLTVLERLNVGL